MAPGKRFFNKRYIVAVGTEREWSSAMISKRINFNGGHHQNKITKDTTHLVVTARAWKAQHETVKEALAVNDDIDNKRNTKHKQRISIVSFDWLDDSWRGEKAKLEEPYKWEKIDPKALKKGANADDQDNPSDDDSDSDSSEIQQKPARKPAGKANAKAKGKKTKENEEPKSHKGMITEVFQESTDKYVSAKEVAAIQKRQEHERRVMEQLAAEEALQKEKDKAAAAFKKRAKKCRNEIFSENHHVYTDETGFKYDVLLTKVDTRRNKNERWALTLQIYESNGEPYTYAMNAQFAGTDTRAANDVMVAVGSSIFVAFHAFKTVFKEKTGVDWDNRISFHLERNKREKLNRGQGTGSDHGTQRGVPVSESNAGAPAIQEDFLTAPFQYHPPQYGAKGTLSESEKEKLQNEWPGILEQSTSFGNGKGKEKATGHEKVNEWINHTTGEQIPIDVDKVFGELSYGSTQIQDTDFDHPYAYPFDGHEGFGLADFPVDQNDPTFDNSLNNIPAVPDSFEAGTTGETQLAEQAGGELMEHLDMSIDQNDTAVEQPKLDLGSSILGKRKVSAAEESPASKMAKPAEVPDSFAEELEVADTPDARAEESLPPEFVEELMQEADPANYQLEMEMAGQEGDQND